MALSPTRASRELAAAARDGESLMDLDKKSKKRSRGDKEKKEKKEKKEHKDKSHKHDKKSKRHKEKHGGASPPRLRQVEAQATEGPRSR